MRVEAGNQATLVDELLERIGKAVGQRAQASAVFGEAVRDGGLTVIPVARDGSASAVVPVLAAGKARSGLVEAAGAARL